MADNSSTQAARPPTTASPLVDGAKRQDHRRAPTLPSVPPPSLPAESAAEGPDVGGHRRAPTLPSSPLPPVPSDGKQQDTTPVQVIASAPATADNLEQGGASQDASADAEAPTDRDSGSGVDNAETAGGDEATVSGQEPNGEGRDSTTESSGLEGLESEIARLNAATSKLEGLCGKIGTEQDSERLRSRIREHRRESEGIFRACYSALRSAPAAMGAEKKSRFMWFRAELDRFKRALLRVPDEDDDDEPAREEQGKQSQSNAPAGSGPAKENKEQATDGSARDARGGGSDSRSDAAANGSDPTSPLLKKRASANVDQKTPPRNPGTAGKAKDTKKKPEKKMLSLFELKRRMREAAKAEKFQEAALYQKKIKEFEERRRKARKTDAKAQHGAGAGRPKPPLEKQQSLEVKIEQIDYSRKFCRTPKAVRLVGILFGVLAIAYSIYELVVFKSDNPGDFVGFLYFAFYGLLILAAEFRVGKWLAVLDNFALLKSPGGLGIFYVFVATNAIGLGGAFGWVVFAMGCFTAIFYFVMASRFKHLYYEDEDAEDTDGKLHWIKKTGPAAGASNADRVSSSTPDRRGSVAV